MSETPFIITARPPRTPLLILLVGQSTCTYINKYIYETPFVFRFETVVSEGTGRVVGGAARRVRGPPDRHRAQLPRTRQLDPALAVAPTHFRPDPEPPRATRCTACTDRATHAERRRAPIRQNAQRSGRRTVDVRGAFLQYYAQCTLFAPHDYLLVVAPHARPDTHVTHERRGEGPRRLALKR
jgi:hypothetical protein